MGNALFAAGVVAVLETKLLTREKIKTIAEAETFEDSIKLLYEAGFGRAKSIEELKKFENALRAETARAVGDLKDLCADERAAEALLLPLDYHNFKTLLKAKATDTPYQKIEGVLYSGGVTDVNRLQMELFEGGGDLRPMMLTALQKITESGGLKDPKVIDTEADLALYADIAALLPKIRSKTVVAYYRTLFDFVNISTLIRNKVTGARDYGAQFIGGGLLPRELFTEAAQETADLAAFFKALKDTDYRQAAETAEASMKTHGNLLDYERYYQNLLFAAICGKKDETQTINPVLYYFFAKKTEIDNIRLILTCKKNRVDKAMIYQRLREQYA